jgi:ankyrin repeat protein
MASLPKIEQPKCYIDASKLAAFGFEAHLTTLLAKGGDIAVATDESGASPIAWAARSGYGQVLKLLAKNGGDINAPTWKLMRPLHHAVNGLHEEATKEILEMRGCQVDAKDESGNTALHLAATRGVVSMCQLLVDKGADVNAMNNSGATPLSFATNMGQVSVVSYLLSKGARHSAADKAGSTPLHIAARCGYAAVVTALLGAGASATAANAAGKTPADVALDAEVAHLLAPGSSPQATPRAAATHQ